MVHSFHFQALCAKRVEGATSSKLVLIHFANFSQKARWIGYCDETGEQVLLAAAANLVYADEASLDCAVKTVLFLQLGRRKNIQAFSWWTTNCPFSLQTGLSEVNAVGHCCPLLGSFCLEWRWPVPAQSCTFFSRHFRFIS